jgi:hypothetical protein
MNVIRHDCECVEVKVAKDRRVVPDTFDDHVCDGWLAKIKDSAAGVVQ